MFVGKSAYVCIRINNNACKNLAPCAGQSVVRLAVLGGLQPPPLSIDPSTFGSRRGRILRGPACLSLLLHYSMMSKAL